jgi:aspartate/methionine/tyrosine aminotransferase
VAQHAALACFEDESLKEYEQRRGEFQRRRDYIVPALRAIGWPVPVDPDGAFYAWIQTRDIAPDSWDLCLRLMQHAQVTLTPGRDFGPALAADHVRLSFASSMESLKEAVARMAAVDRRLLTPTG